MPLLDVVLVAERWAAQFSPREHRLKRIEEAALKEGGFLQYSDIAPTVNETIGGHPEDMNEMPPDLNPFLAMNQKRKAS